MPQPKYQEVGKVVNIHGIAGELRVDCWCDSPEFLRQFKTLLVGEVSYQVLSVRPHKHMGILKLLGVDTVESAQALKNKVLKGDVSGVILPEGRYFVQDLVGLTVLDEATGDKVGTLKDVLFQPAHDVYVVQGEAEQPLLIPAVEAFIKQVDLQAGTMRVAMIEGL